MVNLHHLACAAALIFGAYAAMLAFGSPGAVIMATGLPHSRSSGLEQHQQTPFDPVTDITAITSRLQCGDVCAYGKGRAWMPSPPQCALVWLRLLSSCPATAWPPPKEPPPDLLDAYTMGGQIARGEWFFQQRYSGKQAFAPTWEPASLDAALRAPDVQEMSKHVQPSYGLSVASYVEEVLSKHRSAVQGKAGIVWGSERPWAEVLLARAGAAHTTTIEYGRITSAHPRFTTATPPGLAALMITSPRSWDFAFTYSSLEHSGLGRYGDALNPWGDMEAAVQTWCLLKPGGIFFLGLPCKDARCSQDELVWNAHRFYGPLRLEEVFTGYEVIDTVRPANAGIGKASVIHVLRKPW